MFFCQHDTQPMMQDFCWHACLHIPITADLPRDGNP
jgi:hypothetical protein